MKSFWAAYTADKEKEQNGIWREFKGGLSLCIARADLDTNSKYAQCYQELLTDIDENDSEAAGDAMRQLYARSIVTNGKVGKLDGLVDKNGEAIPFSSEAIVEIFKALPELFKEVREVANKFDNYLALTNKAGKQLGK